MPRVWIDSPTLIKSLFVRRLIKFGAHLLPLREQLQGMTVVESKARGLLRFIGDNEFTGRIKQSVWEHWYL